MNYQVQVLGIIHSLDPIVSPKAYARATFTNPSNVSVEAVGKKLYFTCHTIHKMTSTDSIKDITSNILRGDDTNCEWNINLKPVK